VKPAKTPNVRLSLRAQTVDAKPSGIKLFSKVLFMKPGKRFGLSAEQKSDVSGVVGRQADVA
jgi:hypothetical protein